jgi:hypothetical protein
VTDAAVGGVLQRLNHEDFGSVLADTSSGFQLFGFASGLNDADTRLVRLGARDCDAVTVRWTGKDSILIRKGWIFLLAMMALIACAGRNCFGLSRSAELRY